MRIGFHHFIVNEVYLTEDDKVDAYNNARYGAVSYIPPLSFFLLLSPRKESKFVRFHAKQAFIILLIMIIGYVLPGWYKWGVEAFTWAISLVGFFFAATGRYVAIPGIIHLLSFHMIKESPVLQKIRDARKEEIA